MSKIENLKFINGGGVKINGSSHIFLEKTEMGGPIYYELDSIYEIQRNQSCERERLEGNGRDWEGKR